LGFRKKNLQEQRQKYSDFEEKYYRQPVLGCKCRLTHNKLTMFAILECFSKEALNDNATNLSAPYSGY